MRQLKITGGVFKHCKYSNNPLPPTSFYPDIEWVWDTPTQPNDVYFYTHSAIQRGITDVARTKICWMIEPRELIPHQYKMIEEHHTKFDFVFTHDVDLLNRGANFRFMPFGGCWIGVNDRKIHEKNKGISIVASNKNQLKGHKLRHSVIQNFQNYIDVFGRGYRPIDNKIEAYREYRYSIVIENSKKDYWFTEKLIDSLITGTVPIYWGCPNIGNFFDERGFLIANNIDDVMTYISNANSKLYERMTPYIAENFKLAQNYILSEQFIDDQYLKTNIL